MRIGTIVAVSVLTGCAGAERWEGVWFVERPVLDATACEPGVDENYQDAEPWEAEDDDGDWEIVDESTMSAEAFFVQVLAGRGGDVFVVLGEEVYPGEADRNMLSVRWTGQIDDHFAQEHDDGYLFALDATGTTEEQLVLARDEETDGVHGTWRVTSTTTVSYVETDEWKSSRVGVWYSQIPSWSWLTGKEPDNLPDTRECSDPECALAVTTVCDGAVDVTGRWAGTDGAGLFDAVEDAGQDAGTGTSGGYAY